MQDRLKNDPAYRRLKSSPTYILGHVSYWLASDHVLLVDVIGFVERYRQFRLSDIELIVIRPTRLRMILGIVTACAALPLLGLAGWLWYRYLSESDTDWMVGASIASFFAVATTAFLAGVLIGGPTCQTRLVTGVQSIRLPGLYRQRHAEALAAALSAQARANNTTPASGESSTGEPPPAATVAHSPGIDPNPAS